MTEDVLPDRFRQFFSGAEPPRRIADLPAEMGTWLVDGVPSLTTLCTDFGLRKLGPLPANMLTVRTLCTALYGYAIPCHEVIRVLAALGPLVEVGAGCGFWANLIDRAGGDVVACDDYSAPQPPTIGEYFTVTKMDGARFQRRHRDRHVLMIWPTEGALWPLRVLRSMEPGTKLALVSEGPGGACGSTPFFQYLGMNFHPLREMPLPVWPGMGDHLAILRKL